MARYGRLEIDERSDADWQELALAGELDLATAPMLRLRLRELREAKVKVQLDLSEVSFIDSSGAHAITDALHDARAAGQELQIAPRLAPQVQRMFRILKKVGLLQPS
jgi:anti-anti-sigma factor